jgi:hypothetical protein
MKLLDLKFSDEDLEQVMALAACNYSPELCSVHLGVDKKAFVQLWQNKESEVRQAYDAGKMKATFGIMNKQRELAESGNITAAQIFLKESKEIELNTIRNQCLFGE